MIGKYQRIARLSFAAFNSFIYMRGNRHFLPHAAIRIDLDPDEKRNQKSGSFFSFHSVKTYFSL